MTVGLAGARHRIAATGPVKVAYTISERGYSSDFVAAPDLSVPVILGIPWLREHQAVLDLARGVVHFGIHQRYKVHWL